MIFKFLLAIPIVLTILGAQSCVRGDRVHRIAGGERLLRGLHFNAKKRTMFKNGDHLFINVAKDLTNLIQDVFTETRLVSFTKVNAVTAQNAFIITDKTEKEDVTSLFPNMVNDYLEYKNDVLLTTGNDMVSTYSRRGNYLHWNKTIGELRKMVFELIDKTIEATWLDKQYIQEEKNVLNGMFHKILTRVAQMMDENEYSDKYAVTTFMSNEENADSIPKVKAVERHIEEVLKCLPARIQSWSIESAKFFKMKLNKNG